MTTNVWLRHAAEIWCAAGRRPGPTGAFAEVIRGEVRDHGGNVLFAGAADECVAEAQRWKIPVRLVATEWRRVEGDVAGADHQWQLVVERFYWVVDRCDGSTDPFTVEVGEDENDACCAAAGVVRGNQYHRMYASGPFVTFEEAQEWRDRYAEDYVPRPSQW